MASAKAEVERLGGKRALVLTTPQQEAQGKTLGAALGALYAGIFAGATMHTPVEVTERAMAAMKACERRLHGRARRRLDDRARQGDRACAPTSTSSASRPPMPARR